MIAFVNVLIVGRRGRNLLLKCTCCPSFDSIESRHCRETPDIPLTQRAGYRRVRLLITMQLSEQTDEASRCISRYARIAQKSASDAKRAR